MTIDARAIKLLQPGEHIIDEAHPGLRIEATASTRSWTYRFKSPADGRMRQVALGRWPKVSHERAVVAWEEKRAIRDEGRDPAAEKRSRRQAEVREQKAVVEGPYLVRHLVSDYLDGHLKGARQARGVAATKKFLERIMAPLANAEAGALTRGQAFELLESIKATPVMAQRVRSEMGAAYDYALDAARIPEDTPNWWRLIMKKKLRSKGRRQNGKNIGVGKRSLADGEIGLLVAWMPHLSQLLHDACIVYLWTGTRGAEIMAVEVDEIAQEADGLWWWTVPKHKTKNARHELATDHRVPLFGRGKEVLLRRRAEAIAAGRKHLFPAVKGDVPHVQQSVITAGIHFHQPYCRTRPKIVRPRLPVTRWTPHDLRRTARTVLTALGVPDDVGEAIIGHMQEGGKKVYNRHDYDAQRVEWLGKLDARLEALVQVALPAVATA